MLIKNTLRREYRLKDGTLVPGVTTVLDVLNKPALLKWAWEGGHGSLPQVTFSQWQMQSKDSTAGVGTIAHYKIQSYLKGEKEEYGPGWEAEHIALAQVPFDSFWKYYKSRGPSQAILIEYSAVHEKLHYGGTPDLLVSTPNGVELWEIKTSKAIYEEYYIQLAAYKMLLMQNSKWRALNIKERVVLVAKDGRLEAPDLSRAYMDKARVTWDRLIKMYHKLNEFRNSRQGALGRIPMRA